MSNPKRREAGKSAVSCAASFFAAAQGHHAEGRLPEAALLYGEVLAAQPNHAGALDLLGVLSRKARGMRRGRG